MLRTENSFVRKAKHSKKQNSNAIPSFEFEFEIIINIIIDIAITITITINIEITINIITNTDSNIQNLGFVPSAA